MSFQSGPSKHTFGLGFKGSFEIYVVVFLQIPVEEFSVFMMSQDVDELSQNKPDSTTKQFRREHQEHIYLMYLCFPSSLVPNPEGLSCSALMHLDAEGCLF